MQCLLSPTLADNLRLHCMTDECIKLKQKSQNSSKSLNPDEEKKNVVKSSQIAGSNTTKTCA